MPTPIQVKLVVVLFAALLVFPSVPATAFTPTSAYKEQTIAGYTVLVHPKCFEQPGDATAKALDLLQRKLKEINQLVPKKQLAVLKKVRVWVDWDLRTKANPDGTAGYHPNVGWLKENGYNPDKFKGIEFSMKDNLNADLLIRDQPMVVLHEMTHAYHNQVLGADNPDVKAAYRQAKERKLYDKVPSVHARKYEKPRKAYAMKTDQEYLAELSEAYFGVNDEFPFTWEDLQRHDPVGWDLMVKVWGPIEREVKAVDLTVQNETNKVAVLYWIKADGSLQEFETIKPGTKIHRPTFSGHRWQVQLIGTPHRYFFVAPDHKAKWTVE